MIALFTPGNLLPAAVTLAATFFLVTAVPHDAPPAAAPIVVHAAGDDIARADVQACEGAGDRRHDDCVAEAEGKALIRSAESVARLGSRTGLSGDDELALAAPAHPPRSSAQ